MSVPELWDFAIAVTGKVAGIAARAIEPVYVGHARLSPANVLFVQNPRDINLSFLAAKLLVVHDTLMSPQSRQVETIVRRLPRLLAQLERVCTVCAQPRPRKPFRGYLWLTAVALDPSSW